MPGIHCKGDSEYIVGIKWENTGEHHQENITICLFFMYLFTFIPRKHVPASKLSVENRS